MENVKNAVKNAGHKLEAAAHKVEKSASSAATKVKDSASNTASKVKEGATSVTKGAASTAKKTGSMVSKGASSAVSKTSSAVSSAFKSDEVDGSVRTVHEVVPPRTNGVMLGLLEKRVTAVVKDLDHYRKHGLMSVETDYIIHVKCTTSDGDPDFGFVISKTFCSFRNLANKLYSAAEDVMFSGAKLSANVTRLAKYCNSVQQLIESQRAEYFGKLNYSYIQKMSKERSQIINDFLDATLREFPDLTTVERTPFARKVANLIEKFFLTDHCESVEGEGEKDVFGNIIKQPIRKNYRDVDCTTLEESAVISTKERKSKEARELEEKELAKAANLTVDSVNQGSKAGKKESPALKLVTLVDGKPIMTVAVFAGVMQVLRAIEFIDPLSLELDTVLLIAFFFFVLGVHAPKLVGIGRQQSTRQGEAALMQKTMSAGGGLAEGDGAPVTFESPMKRFPEGAKLGSVFNRWSDPPCSNFNVRGDDYLSNKKKIKSGPFLFKTRGIDLFLTDQSPENVGRIASLMGGELRSVPTFIINFRLPWGVLLFYFEIPERFVMFIKGRYGDDTFTKEMLEASMKEMSNPDRCCARFLLGDDNHKDQTLKIFPAVVEGPWVAKASIGGKPAIIGTKLPVSYVYEEEGTAPDGSKQALYLEADLDVVSNKAARGILSVVRSCTQELTLDLGFAIQGNSEDELPEQMLTGTRIHGIDPLSALPLPPLTDTIFTPTANDHEDSDEESVVGDTI